MHSGFIEELTLCRKTFTSRRLENGLDFLLSALEHLTAASSTAKERFQWVSAKEAQQKRHLKYALLHLCSSIELLFKVRLKQEHWSLVFANINKADDEAQIEGEFESSASMI